MHYFSRARAHTRSRRIIIVINYRRRRNNDGDNNNDVNVSAACLRPTTDKTRTLCKKKFLTAPPRAFYNVVRLLRVGESVAAYSFSFIAKNRVFIATSIEFIVTRIFLAGDFFFPPSNGVGDALHEDAPIYIYIYIFNIRTYVYSLCILRKSARRNGIRTLCRRTLGIVPCCRRTL